MRRRRAGGCLAYVVAGLVIIGGMVSWADFLFKPLTKTPLLESGGLAAVVGDLLKPVPTIYGWPGAGYVFFFSTLLLAFLAVILFMRPVRWTLNYLEASEAPVSVLESRIELYFEDVGLTHCRVTRDQRFHANQPAVEAYHYSQTALKGRIDAQNFSIDSRIDGELVTKNLMKRIAGRTVEIIETFKTPLPIGWWVTYLPDRLVLMLADGLNFFKKTVVIRHVEAHHYSEYDGDSPLFQITAVRYPVSSITICLNFPVATAPVDADVDSYLITSNAVQSVPVVPKPAAQGRKIFSAKLESLRFQQTFRVQWRNTRLETMRATQPELFVP